MDNILDLAEVAKELAKISFTVFAGIAACNGTGIPDWKRFLCAFNNRYLNIWCKPRNDK